MNTKKLRKKIAHLRMDHLYEPDSRNIVFLTDLRGVLDELVHMPGRSLSLSYHFSGQAGKKVDLVVACGSTDEDNPAFMDYLGQRFEPYFSLASGMVTNKQWTKLTSRMAHKFHLVPARRKFELLALGMHSSVKPLLKFVEQVQMLGLKLTVQITIKSLNLDEKKELLRQLPVAGAKMKLTSGGSSAIPSSLDWFSASDSNEKLADDFQKILGYEIQICSAERLNAHAEYIIRRGLLGELGETFTCKKSDDTDENLCYVLAGNASRILQFPLAKQSHHHGLTVQNQPLLINEPSLATSGILLGKTSRTKSHKVIIPEEALNKHCYICGKTGVGKSTLIADMVGSIARGNNQAVVVIDPHGDLDLEIMTKQLSAKDLERVVYVDFGAESVPGLNPLDIGTEQGLEFAIGELTQFFIRLFGSEIFGPRIQDAFRNFLFLLGQDEVPGTICDLIWALNLRDGKVLKQFKEIAQQSNRLDLLLFLEQVLAYQGKDGSFEEMNAYFRAKFSPFTSSMLRHIIGQQRTSIPFEVLIKEKKIVLLNLNKGRLSGQNVGLLGTIITTMLFQSVMYGGSGVEMAKRNPVTVFIDECQNFVSPSIAEILAEARKFKMSLVLASQHLDQLENSGTTFVNHTSLREAILGNVGSLVTFRSSHQSSKILAEELGITITPEQISSLPNYTAIGRLEGHNSFDLPTMFTTRLGKPKRADIKEVRQASEQRYCRPRQDIDAEINQRIREKLCWVEQPDNMVADFFQ